MMDDRHASVMSCQHGRPMGRFAGHNVVCDLFGLPMLPLRIGWYVTVLDLGPWGAVYTEGWDRHVVAKGTAAKKTKQIINRQRIYPAIDSQSTGNPRGGRAGGSTSARELPVDDVRAIEARNARRPIEFSHAWKPLPHRSRLARPG